jgi:hypothetical protein
MHRYFIFPGLFRLYNGYSSEMKRDLGLEGGGWGSNPWVGVIGVIVLVLVLFIQSVVEVASERKEQVPMCKKGHQWKLFGLSLCRVS